MLSEIVHQYILLENEKKKKIVQHWELYLNLECKIKRDKKRQRGGIVRPRPPCITNSLFLLLIF